jgi:hypothetical protein
MKNLQDPRPVTLNDVFEYLHTQLDFFANDPADSNFREGYEQALLDMRHDLLGMSPTGPPPPRFTGTRALHRERGAEPGSFGQPSLPKAVNQQLRV